MGLPKLEIKVDGPVAKDPVILLDGHDISRGVTRFTFSSACGEVNHVTLELLPGSVEVDVEALLELQARQAETP